MLSLSELKNVTPLLTRLYMNIELKKQRLVELLKSIDPTIRLEFICSRTKHTFGWACVREKRIQITPFALYHTYEANLDNLLHELAHIYQYQILGHTKHDNAFVDIKKMLIDDYAPQAAAANKSKTKRYSVYELDKE